jgi:DinB superfamily
MSSAVCVAFHAKIDEQMERAAHLAALLPDDVLQRACEASGGWTAGDLLGHLLDCMAGFCAALYAAEPEKLAHFQQLRELPVNRSVSPKEFRGRLEIYKTHIAEGFALLEDADLARSIPTVFVPAGVSLATLLLGNLEHIVNHKRQLFEILKRLNLNVGTADLYSI